MELHRLVPDRDLDRLREFLVTDDPEDYLQERVEEWSRNGRLWFGEEAGAWVAFGRLHDLGDGEGWVSGMRVRSERRGQGLGRELLDAIVTDARTLGLRSLRAAIEVENLPSRRLFERVGFRSVAEMTLRRGPARAGATRLLHRAAPGKSLDGPVGWFPRRMQRVDLLPGSDGGRFGRWRPSLLGRWTDEGKLYVGSGLAAAVQVDWWRTPRTLWVNPLRGDARDLFPALDELTRRLAHEEWQAFLPSTDALRNEYASLGTLRHPAWGDHILLYERQDGAASIDRRSDRSSHGSG